jgi:hypothetical protein
MPWGPWVVGGEQFTNPDEYRRKLIEQWRSMLPQPGGNNYAGGVDWPTQPAAPTPVTPQTPQTYQAPWTNQGTSPTTQSYLDSWKNIFGTGANPAAPTGAPTGTRPRGTGTTWSAQQDTNTGAGGGGGWL